jgi:hypothetical protein
MHNVSSNFFPNNFKLHVTFWTKILFLKRHEIHLLTQAQWIAKNGTPLFTTGTQLATTGRQLVSLALHWLPLGSPLVNNWEH